MLKLTPPLYWYVYSVECLRCDFTADAPTLGHVFRLEEEHKAEAGEGHLVNWEVDAGPTTSKLAGAGDAGNAKKE